jgi:hypothetical protein
MCVREVEQDRLAGLGRSSAGRSESSADRFKAEEEDGVDGSEGPRTSSSVM